MARTNGRYTFASTDSTINVPGGGKVVSGRVAVYARRTSGSGTATLAVRGGFSDDLDDVSNESVQITAPTAMGTGALTVITADAATPFTHFKLVYDVTGTATYEVFVSTY